MFRGWDSLVMNKGALRNPLYSGISMVRLLYLIIGWKTLLSREWISVMDILRFLHALRQLANSLDSKDPRLF